MDNSKQDEFWADKVQRLKKQGLSEEVIREARKHIPYPAAFKEIAIAIRRDIRTKRKEGTDTKSLLRKLHKWAVIENFVNHVDWGWIISDRIIHSTSHSSIQGIKSPYKTVGYKELGLLRTTDIKWLIETFGEPNEHKNAKEANPELWDQAVEKFRLAREKDEQRLQRESKRLFGNVPSMEDWAKSKKRKNKGCLTMIAIVIVPVFLAMVMVILI